MAGVVRVGSRGSALALRQAAIVGEALRPVAGVPLEVVPVRTAGDRDRQHAVSEFPADGVFVRALEEKLLSGDIDLAVHSLKDLPSRLLPGLTLAAFLGRADPADVLVSRQGDGLADLPEGARVGTGSARRRALLLEARPDLRVQPVRGNVDTRLRKLEAGEYDALVLAAAGLERLGIAGVNFQRLDPEHFVPSPGQGTLAVEVVEGSGTQALVQQIDEPATRATALAERAFVAALGMGCVLPAGAHAMQDGERLRMIAVLGTDEGLVLREEATGEVGAAAELGAELAQALLRRTQSME